MMSLGIQIIWLFVLALPIAAIAGTVTHEEVFHETRNYCVHRKWNKNKRKRNAAQPDRFTNNYQSQELRSF